MTVFSVARNPHERGGFDTVGAVVGAGMVKLALPSEREGDLTVSHLPAYTSAGEVCVMEVNPAHIATTCSDEANLR
jgi:hypothetical protein